MVPSRIEGYSCLATDYGSKELDILKYLDIFKNTSTTRCQQR